jgi:hypothetical protein
VLRMYNNTQDKSEGRSQAHTAASPALTTARTWLLRCPAQGKLGGTEPPFRPSEGRRNRLVRDQPPGVPVRASKAKRRGGRALIAQADRYRQLECSQAVVCLRQSPSSP